MLAVCVMEYSVPEMLLRVMAKTRNRKNSWYITLQAPQFKVAKKKVYKFSTLVERRLGVVDEPDSDAGGYNNYAFTIHQAQFSTNVQMTVGWMLHLGKKRLDLAADLDSPPKSLNNKVIFSMFVYSTCVKKQLCTVQ